MLLDTEALLRFCAAHPVGSLEPGLRRRLLTTLSSGPPVVRTESGEPVLVAAVADRLLTASRCALFVLLGLRRDTAPAHLLAALKQAEALVRRGPCTGIEINLSAAPAPLEVLLPRAGYQPAFSSYLMEAHQAPSAPAPLPGPRWRWVEARPAHVSDYRRTLLAAMADVPGAYMPSEADLVAALTEHPGRVWLLLHDTQIAGFFRARRGAEDWGEVELLGRHPSRRGQGLGGAVLGQAMVVLAQQGAQRFRLDVAAENRAALSLYRRCGFAVVAEEVTWRKHLR